MIWVFSFLILVLAALLPGAAAIRWFRFSSESALEQIVVVPVIGITLSGTAVLVLLAARLYFWPFAALLLTPPAVYLYLQFRRSKVRFSRPSTFVQELAALPFLDKVALLIGASAVLVALVDAATSPPTWWDGYIMWDKWAMDWGGRHHLYGYLCAYPQLFPMFASLVYKLTGTAGSVLPPSTMALHVISPLLAFVGLAAVTLLAQRFGMPAWPLVLACCGMRTWREQLITGTADIMVTTFTVVAVSIALGLTQPLADTSERGPRLVLVILLFGAVAVKTTGVLAIVTVGAYLFTTFRSQYPPGTRSVLNRTRLLLLVLPIALCMPFVAEQFFTERTLTPEKQDPQELNFPFATISSAWKGSREALTGSPFSPRQAAARILADYSIPERLHAPTVVIGTLLLALGLLDARIWPVALPVVLHGAVWFRLFSYDQRNLLPAAPFFGLWLTVGGVRLWTLCHRWPRFRGTVAALLASAVLPWPVAGGSISYVATQWKAFDDGRLVLRRLNTMRDGPEERIREFFPDQYSEYLLLKHSGVADAAQQVVAGSHLYRWFPNGRYPLARFSLGNLQPGDIWVGNTSVQPPEPESWLLIRSVPLKVYVFKPVQKPIPFSSLWLTGANPPVLVRVDAGSMSVSFSGAMSVVVYNVLRERPAPGSRIIWQVDCEAGDGIAALSPFQLVYDPSVIDQTASTTAVDNSHAGVARYAGMLTLTRRVFSTDPRDGVLVGLRSDVPGTRCKLREFRVAVTPPSVP